MNRPGLLLLLGALLGISLGRDAFAIVAEESVTIEIGGEVGRFPRMPVPDHVRLAADWNKDCRAWEQRVIVAPFAKRVEGEAWGEGAVAFLSASLDAWRMGNPASPRPELAASGASVLAGGCNDPLIRYFVNYWAWWNSVSHQESMTRNLSEKSGYAASDGDAPVRRMREARDDLEKEGAPAALLVLITNDILSGDEAAKRIARLLPQALSEGSYSESDAEVFVGQMLRWNVPMKSQIHDFLGIVEKSSLPEWAKLTLQGHLHREAAWESRGGDTADKVTEEGWRGFGEQMRIAEEELTKSWELEPHAETANEMLPVLLAGKEGGENSAVQWLQKGMAVELDYPGFPGNWLWFHLPRWGGTYLEMLAYARSCNLTGRYDADLGGIFADALVRVAIDGGANSSELAKVPSIGEGLVEWVQGKVADPSGKAEIHKWRSLLVTRAWLAGKLQVAKAALDEIPGGALDPTACAELIRFGFPDSEFVLNDLSVIGSDAEKPYFAGNQAVLERKRDVALREYKAALAVAPEGRARKYLSARVASVEFERKFATSEWTEVPLDLAQWEVRAGGAFSSDKDGGLVVRPAAERTGALVFMSDMGLSYEVRGTFERLDPSTDLAPFCFAVREHRDRYIDFLAMPDSGGDFACRLESQRQVIKERDHGTARIGAENNFLIRSTPSSVTCELNDHEVFPRYESNRFVGGVPNSFLSHVALIAVPGVGESAVKIKKLEARKLEGPDETLRPQSASGAIGQ